MKKCNDCKYMKRVSLLAYTCTKEKVFTKYVEPNEICDYKKMKANGLKIRTNRNETEISMKELLLNIEVRLVEKYDIYQTEEILQIVKKEINKI
jgi:hypothetical protein